MLKTDSLPARQEETNSRLSAELRTLFVTGLLVLVSGLCGFLLLVYAGPDERARTSELVSADGSVMGVAAIVSQSLAIADGTTPDHVQIRLPNRKLVEAVKVRTETFAARASLSLLRAREQFPDPDVPALGSEPSGALHATTPGNAEIDPKNGPIHVAPETGLGPGVPVYQDQCLWA